MSEYTLFGQKVVFDDATERFFDFQQAAWDAMSQAENEFRRWYKECGKIDNVIAAAGRKKTAELVEKYATNRLFGELRNLEIYDMSKASYEKECVDYTQAYRAFSEIEDSFTEILDKQCEAEEYRAERKENRGRYVGGGFGLGGAIGGAMQAGALNMLSGAGHSLVNAVGNLGSSIEANNSFSALYASDRTQDTLVSGLRDTILFSYNAHMNLINKLLDEDYRYSPFDKDKAEALLDSAKNVPEKREDLLVKAFTAFPYKIDILEYIFENYADERKNVWNISKRFHVDLKESVKKIIAQVYTGPARTSDTASQTAKQKIKEIMAEYGITTNETLNQLDKDYLSRLCRNVDAADKDTCFKLREAVTTYDTADDIKMPFIVSILNKIDSIDKDYLSRLCKNVDAADKDACCKLREAVMTYDTSDDIKMPFIESIQKKIDSIDKEYLDKLCAKYGYLKDYEMLTCNEDECNKLLDEINAYDASSKVKKHYVDMTHQRIEQIWSEEDFKRFKEIYIQTSAADINEITKNIDVVRKTGRTKEKEKFITAFSSLNPENIRLAADYGVAKEKGKLAVASKLTRRGIYMKLTLDGKVIHPDIASAMDAIRSEQPAKGEKKWGFFGGKQPNNQTVSNISTSNEGQTAQGVQTSSSQETVTSETANADPRPEANRQPVDSANLVPQIKSLLVRYNYPGLFSVTGNNDFQKKLSKATAAYANISADEVPILLRDQSLFGSAKEGYVVTNKRMIANTMYKERFTFSLQQIEAVQINNSGKDYCVCILAGPCHVNAHLVGSVQVADKLRSLWIELIKSLTGNEVEAR